MNSKKILGISFCFGLALILFGLARYQMDYADEPTVRDGKDVIHILANQKDLSTLSDLISRAGLHPILEKVDSVTIVAPTNEAFNRLRDMLGEDAYNRIIHDKAQLQKLLSHHIILNKESTDEMSTEDQIHTLEGTSIAIHKSPQGTLRLNGRASIIPQSSNIDASNAFIHSIDEVIIPDKLE